MTGYSKLIYSDTEKYGTKYAVQKLFSELEMCEVKTDFYIPGKSAKIESILENFDFKKGVTIRFSYQKALNLPRMFFNNKKKCIEFIKFNSNYVAIIQEYVKLENSFELYMTKDLIYLQVLPGIWEVSTKEMPDIMKYEDGKLITWRYKQNRKAKLAHKSGDLYFSNVKPFVNEELIEFVEKLKEYKDSLLSLLDLYNPLCCHFYMSSNKKYSFLNVRNFGDFPINNDSPKYLYEINDDKDIDELPLDKPILFNIRGERDDDRPLVEAIKKLAEKGVKKVYVKYGILSHPAILLREEGIKVEQSYTLYDRNELTFTF